MPIPQILGGISAVIPLLQSAISVVAAFKGSAAAAKTTSAVQDAVQVIGAVVPLIQQFGSGVEVTPSQVRVALAGKNAALADFDAEIAKQSGGAP